MLLPLALDLIRAGHALLLLLRLGLTHDIIIAPGRTQTGISGRRYQVLFKGFFDFVFVFCLVCPYKSPVISRLRVVRNTQDTMDDNGE